jgi:hypothetical protein
MFQLYIHINIIKLNGNMVHIEYIAEIINIEIY